VDQDTIKTLIVPIVLLLLGGAVTFISTRIHAKRREFIDEVEKRERRISELERQLAVLNQVVVPISTAFQAILIKELTHMHTPEMDALLAKIGPPSTLTDAEEVELAEGLAQRAKDMGDQISESERDAALILPSVIKRAKAESVALALGDPMTLRLVTVAAVGEDKHTEETTP